jgi:alpha-beta hydrolase superfamily lysophospholipase
MVDTLVLEGRRRRRRRWPWVLLAVVLVVVAGFAAAGWYYATQLTGPPTIRPFEPDNEVVATSGDQVTLRDEGFAAQDARWGLQLPEGRHVVLGDVIDRGGDVVTRTFSDVVGEPPRSGEPVRVDEFVYVGDPASALGLPFEEVTIDGALGPLPAWRLAGERERWVVLVHGRGATREETLRFLPVLHDLGYPVLVPTYRGDGVAPDPERGVAFGLAEWRDVESAVRYALDEGADDVVLMGLSMGGTTTAAFLQRSPLESVVAGAVLDSPVLSMDAVLRLQADLAGIPGPVQPPILWFAELFARLTSDLDTRELELVDEADSFDVPLLLIHGGADEFVPVGPSDEFAAARPATTYLRVDDAGHVRSWNVAPERYERTLEGFLDGLER